MTEIRIIREPALDDGSCQGCTDREPDEFIFIHLSHIIIRFCPVCAAFVKDQIGERLMESAIARMSLPSSAQRGVIQQSGGLPANTIGSVAHRKVPGRSR
jgi:hypothetical protein